MYLKIYLAEDDGRSGGDKKFTLQIPNDFSLGQFIAEAIKEAPWAGTLLYGHMTEIDWAQIRNNFRFSSRYNKGIPSWEIDISRIEEQEFKELNAKLATSEATKENQRKEAALRAEEAEGKRKALIASALAKLTVKEAEALGWKKNC